MAIINLDADGTLFTHDFPRIGKDIGAIPVLRKLIANKHKFILFTMRAEVMSENGNLLQDAVDWFKQNDIPLYGIQKNPTQHNWTTSPKSHADLIIDDSALGCPLILNLMISERPYADWTMIEKMLIARGFIAEYVKEDTSKLAEEILNKPMDIIPIKLDDLPQEIVDELIGKK